MHALHPMQMLLSKSTIPSGRLNIAAVGHAATQGGDSHWLQPRDLEGAARLRECSGVYVLYIGARDGKRNFILGLAGGRAGVTADAPGLVHHLGPGGPVAALGRVGFDGHVGGGSRFVWPGGSGRATLTIGAAAGCEQVPPRRRTVTGSDRLRGAGP